MSIKNILISQNAPRVLTQYQAVSEKFGTQFTFRPFFCSMPLSSREFRAQRNHMNARARNAGWRIDYFLVSEDLKDSIVSTDILGEIFGSDHCPVELLLGV